LKVLLTGASGFVGSHVLDTLRAREIPTAILLRPTSNARFIQAHLASVEVRSGALSDPSSLRAALAGITHLIHCAGSTKAVTASDFFAANASGTLNLVTAASAQQGLRRVVHVSSLAAFGPALPHRSAGEDDPPSPVSTYGHSKLAGEAAVREHCRPEYVILRPPAVYGPRDEEFFRIFKAVQFHVLARPTPQPLSLVFVRDLAEAIVACLDRPPAARATYFVGSPEVVTARQMADEIAREMRVWTVPLPTPPALLWPICLAQELISRLTGRPSVLNLQKFAELRAPGWVCDSSRLQRETGLTCPTLLKPGIAQTHEWYLRESWLRT
jgi:nucleoside-diphosphate-sugar epimerase